MNEHKLWLLEHDAGTLLHISPKTWHKDDVRRHFPEYEISELRPATTERTFRLHVLTETTVSLS